MNDAIRQFAVLLNTDAAFQEKLKSMLESYDGEQTEEAVFANVLLPLGKEHGISADFEDFKAYMNRLNDHELNAEELSQLTGGTKGAGLGVDICVGVGIGLGAGGGDEGGGVCAVVGVGWGAAECLGDGKTTPV